MTHTSDSDRLIFNQDRIRFMKDFSKVHYYGVYSSPRAADLREYFAKQQTPFLEQINKKNDFFAYKQTDPGTGSESFFYPQIEYSYRNRTLFVGISASNDFDFIPYLGKLILDQVVNHSTVELKVKVMANQPYQRQGRLAHFVIQFERTLGDRFRLFFEMNVLNDFIDFSMFYVVLLILICKWTILVLIFLKEISFISKSNYEYNIWFNIKVA